MYTEKRTEELLFVACQIPQFSLDGRAVIAVIEASAWPCEACYNRNWSRWSRHRVTSRNQIGLASASGNAYPRNEHRT